MAEKETKNNPKDLIEAVPEEVSKIKLETTEAPAEAAPAPAHGRRERYSPKRREQEDRERSLAIWVPKTKLGRAVREGKLKNIDEVLVGNKKVLEAELVESLLHLESDLLLIGQAKGKFGGGKRRAWRQTQKKTMEGNVVTFSCMAIVGDRKGHVGIGYGKAKETLPARAKALRNAKINVIKVSRGFETPEGKESQPHTVPFVVQGKAGSVRIKLLPAPRGTGLVIGDEGKKVLRLAGIEDVYSVTHGQTRTTFNVAKAIIEALKKTNMEILQ